MARVTVRKAPDGRGAEVRPEFSQGTGQDMANVQSAIASALERGNVADLRAALARDANVTEMVLTQARTKLVDAIKKNPASVGEVETCETVLSLLEQAGNKTRHPETMLWVAIDEGSRGDASMAVDAGASVSEDMVQVARTRMHALNAAVNTETDPSEQSELREAAEKFEDLWEFLEHNRPD